MAKVTRSKGVPGESEAAELAAGEVPRRQNTVGALLRQTRQSYNSDIDQIAAALRIRASFLKAIEEGRYAELPGTVYGQGFVRAYAHHLGLDGDEAVRRFKQETASLEKPRDLSFPMPLAQRSMPGGSTLLIGVIIALCGYGAWYYLSSSDRARPERVAAVPTELLPPAPPPAVMSPPDVSAAAPLSPTEAAPGSAPPPVAAPVAAPPAIPAVAVPPAAVPASATAASSAPATPDAGHIYGPEGGPIVLRATADCWIHVRDGNQSVAIRTLHAGDLMRVAEKTGLEMEVGNAASLEVSVDGVTVPALHGRIRHHISLDPDRLRAGTADTP